MAAQLSRRKARPGNLPPQAHASGYHAHVTAHAGREYWLSWRRCEVWERPVVDRAYAAGVVWAAELVKVAGR